MTAIPLRIVTNSISIQHSFFNIFALVICAIKPRALIFMRFFFAPSKSDIFVVDGKRFKNGNDDFAKIGTLFVVCKRGPNCFLND